MQQVKQRSAEKQEEHAMYVEAKTLFAKQTCPAAIAAAEGSQNMRWQRQGRGRTPNEAEDEQQCVGECIRAKHSNVFWEEQLGGNNIKHKLQTNVRGDDLATEKLPGCLGRTHTWVRAAQPNSAAEHALQRCRSVQNAAERKAKAAEENTDKSA